MDGAGLRGAPDCSDSKRQGCSKEASLNIAEEHLVATLPEFFGKNIKVGCPLLSEMLGFEQPALSAPVRGLEGKPGGEGWCSGQEGRPAERGGVQHDRPVWSACL